MQSQQLNMTARLRRCPPSLTTIAQAPLLGVASARSGPWRRLSLVFHAAKGFGKPKPTAVNNPGDDDGPARGRKGKAKRVQLQPGNTGPIPNQQLNQAQSQDVRQSQFQTELLAPEQSSEEEEDFMARLQALKAQGKELAAAAAAPAAAATATAITPAIFDAVPSTNGGASDGEGGIYANPPPLAQTLLTAAGGGAAATDISDPKLRDANIGPSQLGLAVGAIVFVAIFILVAAGDYAPSSRRYSGIKPAQVPPDPIEEKILAGKVSLYEEQLKADPNNDDAAEALATSYARLLQYDKAAGLLEKLSKRNPNDAEIWRLLGESSLLSQQPRKAVPAFERAVQLRRQQQQQELQQKAVVGTVVVTQPDLQLLTGLVDAYIANNDYSKAVDALRDVREELRTRKSEQVAVRQKEETQPAAAGGGEASVSAAVAAEAVAAADAEATEAGVAAAAAEPEILAAPPLTDDSGAASTSADSPPPPPPAPASSGAAAALSSAVPSAAVRPLDPVGVELLTAKVYSAWRGHDQDALATYDELIKEFPEDYRGYLAKGVFLKEKGRKADAERMFLQARFFAPASKQQLVRAIADSTPKAPQLPDNN
ncbi:hypothetical protein Vretimale_17581 [Volvox reticuliferus]|uniref:Uncharacterized protein n=1 Tax=Volvox reticuliferus TaxID=1737510 RepID=A0A8J4LXF4_9CHLO|nr:hypothetical protein Vretifemale_3544 [Volvox reticuliferus]GIM14773.1 hypothetical protein Vretimale_17581 [Volvox reticuliferus]